MISVYMVNTSQKTIYRMKWYLCTYITIQLVSNIESKCQNHSNDWRFSWKMCSIKTQTHTHTHTHTLSRETPIVSNGFFQANERKRFKLRSVFSLTKNMVMMSSLTARSINALKNAQTTLNSILQCAFFFFNQNHFNFLNRTRTCFPFPLRETAKISNLK